MFACAVELLDPSEALADPRDGSLQIVEPLCGIFLPCSQRCLVEPPSAAGTESSLTNGVVEATDQVDGNGRLAFMGVLVDELVFVGASRCDLVADVEFDAVVGDGERLVLEVELDDLGIEVFVPVELLLEVFGLGPCFPPHGGGCSWGGCG